MVNLLKAKHPLRMLCNHLNISVSGYLAHQQHPVSQRQQRDQRLITHIRAAHERGRGSYGPSKIQKELVEQSHIYLGINSIKRLRKIAGIRCKQKRKFRVTTDSKHKLPVAPNLLNRQFNPSSPNQVWVADITYIPTDETVKVFTAHLSR
jgi:putative transposase